MSGEVEADETYIGGREGNKHLSKKTSGNQGSKGKAPVLEMVERGGKVKAVHVKDTGMTTLSHEIIKNFQEASKVYTDEYLSYKKLRRVYDHSVVKHSAKQYVDDRVHTNTIESFWALLKRGIFGIYHFTSVKNLQLYVDEFSFRYNSRDLNENQRFNLFLDKVGNKCTYKQLIK